MFKFTIRELVCITLIAAVCVAWWVERRRLGQLEGKLKTLADKVANYELAEKQQQIKKNVEALQWQMHSLRNNEFGARKPWSEQTPEERAEVERVAREQMKLMEQMEELERQKVTK